MGKLSGAVLGKHGVPLIRDQEVATARADRYDALVLPGNRGPDQIRAYEHVQRFTREFFDRQKPMAAICHGPPILISADVLKGVHCTAVNSVAKDAQNAGAIFEDAKPSSMPKPAGNSAGAAEYPRLDARHRRRVCRRARGRSLRSAGPCRPVAPRMPAARAFLRCTGYCAGNTYVRRRSPPHLMTGGRRRTGGVETDRPCFPDAMHSALMISCIADARRESEIT